MNQDETIPMLEAQIRECFARVVITHKTQEQCADILNRRSATLKNVQIALSALTTGGLIAALITEQQIATAIAAVISASLFGLNNYAKHHTPGEVAQEHESSASKLWNIRELYLSLLTDIRGGHLEAEQIRDRRDELQRHLLSVYTGAPRSLGGAYRNAIKNLREHERTSFSDAEIDKMLPPALKRRDHAA